MLEVALIADEHHNDARVRMRAELLEPPLDVLKGKALRYIVHEQRADGATVVRARNCAVALLAGCAHMQDTAGWAEWGSGAIYNLPVSQICALIILPSCWMLRVANSTPMVDFESRWNSFRVKRLRRFDLPTPESPIMTTLKR